jgi:hypothetical protein
MSVHLFASGRGESQERQTQNDEWILCITSFDVSSLPAEELYLTEVLKRKIVERLTTISYRTRISPEYAYYEAFAWANTRSVAARAIAAKQDERSALIFRGEPNWRYRQNLARIDAELEKLRATLEEVEKNAPLINREPVFNLTRGNLDFSFPAPPEAGREYRFCIAQRADAFLSGSIVNFHGRYVLSVKLYTVYTRSFVWEDSIIFSLADIEEAVDEFTRRLLVKLSGKEPAAIAVIAEPQDTLVLINRSFAGRGSTDVLEIPPGTVTVTASAQNHESITFETTLSSNELTVVNISLNPVRFIDVAISADSAGRIYHGALYVGNAPHTLRLPVNNLEYIEVITTSAKMGTMVFQTPDTVGNAGSYPQSLYLKTETPLARGRVERERRAFYWAWGGTWITGIAAWITYGLFISQNEILHLSQSRDFFDSTQMLSHISNGTLIAVGVKVGYKFFELARYLRAATDNATPIARQERRGR